jgi:hypothetical protein
MFEIDKLIQVGSVLNLEIYQPSNFYKEDVVFSIPAQARVVWINKKEDTSKKDEDNKYKVGVEFVEIGERERNVMAGYVQDKLKTEKQ